MKLASEKIDSSGAKFGFVRFPSLREAKTVVVIFGGDWVIDQRIQVTGGNSQSVSSSSSPPKVVVNASSEIGYVLKDGQQESSPDTSL
ncbi:hypothetical protein V6N11_017168 [Hibiscus sabdariffa]|uniref:RRM domain-containing protein n=1 Tax=Hibiscus sabdariffa TaxID=183260 RepID=A0ABR2TXI5_9ROSI